MNKKCSKWFVGLMKMCIFATYKMLQALRITVECAVCRSEQTSNNKTKSRKYGKGYVYIMVVAFLKI